MFILHSSNKTENLLIHLTTVIENSPLNDPLSSEVFLIQSQGMERWLSQQLADHFGVWANSEFLFPGKFFSSIARKIDEQLNDEAFDRNLILWRFELLLRNLKGDCFIPIQNYIQGDNQDLKRFQLAQKFSSIFDQYQMMRIDMLEAWQQGRLFYPQTKNEIWQRELWKQITAITGQQHRGTLWRNVIQKFNTHDEGYFATQLPERIFVFGVNTMPPLFLDYLQGLSRHCDVHLFLLNPTAEYWADLANKKYWNEDSEGHPLLASLGQQGREFQQMILEQTKFDYEPESFEAPEATQLNNLQQLQHDILHNQLERVKLKPDNSISLHACHSRMREVEVLKDQLLLALKNDTTLELRDIVVMAPDIQRYAPFISAVFDDIQHSIADKTLQLSNSALDAFVRFLNLSQSRFGWQTVIDLLEQPVVYQQFSLSETDLELIKHWVKETQVRWGKSAQHKQTLDLPELNQNTWQAMLDRLFMGYAVGNDEHFVDNILAYRDIEGESAQVLGRFNNFMQLLFKASDALNNSMPLSQWGQQLYDYADQLLASNTPEQHIERQELNALLADLSETIATIHQEDISLSVICAWLETRLSESKSSTGFLRGKLTFCSMLPMRSIPFKVIALLGINEGEFPNTDHYLTFDLIGQNYRKGDRSRRADDRYQFLEILLSSRQQLIITYQGLSSDNNSEIPPSVIMSELLDVLDNYYQLNELITQHPLQAFSSRYFNNENNLSSFSKSAHQTAEALNDSPIQPLHWWTGELPSDPIQTIEIRDLLQFYRNPQRYFLQRQLDIHLTELPTDVAEREPFELNSLDKYTINDQWIEHQLNNTEFSLPKLQAQGRWLSGIQGELDFNKQHLEIEPFIESIKAKKLGNKQTNQAIHLTVVGSYQLTGNLTNLYENGSLFYHYTELKGKSFIAAWIHHLIINQTINLPQDTHLLSKDASLIFQSDQASSKDLIQLIEVYLQGCKCPDTFFTEACFAHIKQSANQKSKSTPLMAAQKALYKELEYNHYLQQLYQNQEDLSEILNPAFIDCCNDLFLPIWKAVKQ